MLEKSILKNNKNAKVSICLDEVEALKHALNISNKNDIIVVFFEDLKRLTDFIKKENVPECVSEIYNF